MARLVRIRKTRTRDGVRRAHLRHVRTSVTIPHLERQVLTSLTNYNKYPVEMGGGLDFKTNGRLERIHLQRGTKDTLDLPPDFEAQFHTHPTPRGATMPPASPEDVLSLLRDKRQQAELVVGPGHTDVITKTASIKALSKLPATRVFRRLDRAYTSTGRLRLSDPVRTRRWYDTLRALGFAVQTHPNTGPLHLAAVRPVEPRRGGSV